MSQFNNNSEDKKIFFIALLPPLKVQKYATKVKEHFAQQYNTKAALKSPPHITLQPPFFWSINNLSSLEKVLQKFARNYAPIPIELQDFSAFKPRVIYINVTKTTELLTLQNELNICLESSLQIVDKKSKNRPFCPHLTVAFKDLSKTNFYRAWDEFKHQQVYFNFNVNQLTLLSHNGQQWEIQTEFDFSQ